MKHPFPRLEWTPCAQRPDGFRRVLVWHRFRKCCRIFEAAVGWWNGEQWLTYEVGWIAGPGRAREIYQPLFWKDIDPPQTS